MASMAAMRISPAGTRLSGRPSAPTKLVQLRLTGLRAPAPLGSLTQHAPARHQEQLVPQAAAGGSGPTGGGSSGGGGGGGSSGDASHPMRPWTFLFAALLAIGGGMGFIKKGSTQSLGAGLSASLILALAARSMTGPTVLSGVRVAFGVTLMLGVFFISRFARTKKVFPAGVGAGVSLGYAAAYVASGL